MPPTYFLNSFVFINFINNKLKNARVCGFEKRCPSGYHSHNSMCQLLTNLTNTLAKLLLACWDCTDCTLLSLLYSSNVIFVSFSFLFKVNVCALFIYFLIFNLTVKCRDTVNLLVQVIRKPISLSLWEEVVSENRQ